jgi:hypothetical protein
MAMVLQRVVRAGLAGLVALMVVGCGELADPNNLAQVPAADKPEAARAILNSAVEILDYKVTKGEITDTQRVELISQEADRLLALIDPKAIAPADCWIYADMLRTTKRYDAAIPYLEKAVAAALRLAQAYEMVGKVQLAVKTAESVFNVPDDQCAPILPATLYEIVPAAQKKGDDRALARLLTEAIACHLRTKVDTSTEAGKLFVAARSHHVSRAQAKILELGGTGTASL